VTTSQIAQAADPTGRKIPPGLPMPTDLEMVFDPSRRPRAARETRGRFPFPIPERVVSSVAPASNRRRPGRTFTVAAPTFGRDLVLFRGEDGAFRTCSTPTCPHLGAHLGVGGRVEEGVHPVPVFHGWKFDWR